ncbi:MAG: hypothetical protein K9M96_10520 [Deltaproteobacteria bacterium]|nr:hypothetical protein [Deltaproteobacteria bacterium]
MAGVITIKLATEHRAKLFLTTSLLLIIVTGLLLEHYLYGAKYPSGRTALIFIPIYGVFIYYLFSAWITYLPVKKQFYVPIVIILVVPLFFNFILSINTTYTKTWRYDAHTKDAMILIKEKGIETDHDLTVSNHWMFEPTINYYIATRNIPLKPANREGVNNNSDFIYTFTTDEIPTHFIKVHEYSDTGTVLLMKPQIASI